MLLAYRVICFYTMFIKFNKFIGLCWMMTLSCKDLKNWQSRYSNELKIQLKPEMDEHVPNVVKNLRSQKFQHELFELIRDGGIKIVYSLLDLSKFSIALPIDANSVQIVFRNAKYAHKVTILYERTVSLISPLAGGLQQQYYIKAVKFDSYNQQIPLFKTYKIEHPVLLKDQENSHVTLYY